ncbi:DUF6244 family protein [Micromonospora zhanjiangensis]|uniref:DUF6244 family protein n=1 Tax=Micromonospora zhanjiangensis TaxID=1522057 RepID=A0ABV8KXK7_9ACTN
MSAAEMIARLTAATQKLNEAKAKAAAAAQDANEARTLVAGALEGAASKQLVDMVGGVVEHLSHAGQAAASTTQQVQQTIARVQALGN